MHWWALLSLWESALQKWLKGRKFISLPHDGPDAAALQGKRRLPTGLAGVSLFPQRFEMLAWLAHILMSQRAQKICLGSGDEINPIRPQRDALALHQSSIFEGTTASPSCHQLGTKYSNTWAHGGQFTSKPWHTIYTPTNKYTRKYFCNKILVPAKPVWLGKSFRVFSQKKRYRKKIQENTETFHFFNL